MKNCKMIDFGSIPQHSDHEFWNKFVKPFRWFFSVLRTWDDIDLFEKDFNLSVGLIKNAMMYHERLLPIKNKIVKGKVCFYIPTTCKSDKYTPYKRINKTKKDRDISSRLNTFFEFFGEDKLDPDRNLKTKTIRDETQEV